MANSTQDRWVLGHRRSRDFLRVLDWSESHVWCCCATVPSIGEELRFIFQGREIQVQRRSSKFGARTLRLRLDNASDCSDPFTEENCSVEASWACEPGEVPLEKSGRLPWCLELRTVYPDGGRKRERFRQISALVLCHDMWLTPALPECSVGSRVGGHEEGEREKNVSSLHVQHFYWLRNAEEQIVAEPPQPRCKCPPEEEESDLPDVWLPDEEIRFRELIGKIHQPSEKTSAGQQTSGMQSLREGFLSFFRTSTQSLQQSNHHRTTTEISSSSSSAVQRTEESRWEHPKTYQLQRTAAEETVLGRRVLWALRQQSELEMASQRHLPELSSQPGELRFLVEAKEEAAEGFLRAHAWLHGLTAEIQTIYGWVYQITQLESKLSVSAGRFSVQAFPELHAALEGSLQMGFQLNEKQRHVAEKLFAWDKARAVFAWLAREYNLRHSWLRMWKEARRKIPETHPLLVKGDFLLDQSAKEIVSRLTLIGIAESFGNSEDLVKRIDRHQEKVLQQELSGDLLGFHFMSDDPSGFEGWMYSDIKKELPFHLFQRAKLGSRRKDALTVEQVRKCLQEMRRNLRTWFDELRALLQLGLALTEGVKFAAAAISGAAEAESGEGGEEEEEEEQVEEGEDLQNILAVLRRVNAERSRLTKLRKILRGKLSEALSESFAGKDFSHPRQQLQELFR